MRRNTRIVAVGVFSLSVAYAAAATAEKPAPEATTFAPEAIDITPIADALRILTDGNGHYLALVPFGSPPGRWEHVFYGDGAQFFQQRVVASNSVAREQFNFTFWDPRMKDRQQAGLSYTGDEHRLRCADREIDLVPLPEENRKLILQHARFFKPLWKHEAFALARDDRGIYYYVDRLRESSDSQGFRVFRGPRGQLALMDMANVASDSAGDIFASHKGHLRLIVGKNESWWIRGAHRIPLVNLPLFENATLIYRDLGPYAGKRLGTPCDDL